MRRVASVRLAGGHSQAAPPPADVTYRVHSHFGAPSKDNAIVPWAPSWAATPESRFWPRYRWFLGITAFVHLVSGIAAASLIVADNANWPVRLCASSSVWTPAYPAFHCFDTLYNSSTGNLTSAAPVGNYTTVFNICNRGNGWKHVGTINPGAMVVAFFLLSFVFQVRDVTPT